MRFSHPLLVPKNEGGGHLRQTIITTAISLVGILFFNWQVGAVIFLFYWELVLIGAATLLRMLFAVGDNTNYLIGLLPRLFWMVGFGVLYGAMIMLFIAFVFAKLDTDALFENFTGFKYGVWLLGFNYAASFLFGYLYNDTYKRSTYMAELFKTMFFALPLLVIMVMIVAPNSEILGASRKNSFVAAAIVLLKFAFDFVAFRLQKRLKAEVSNKNEITQE